MQSRAVTRVTAVSSQRRPRYTVCSCVCLCVCWCLWFCLLVRACVRALHPAQMPITAPTMPPSIPTACHPSPLSHRHLPTCARSVGSSYPAALALSKFLKSQCPSIFSYTKVTRVRTFEKLMPTRPHRGAPRGKHGVITPLRPPALPIPTPLCDARAGRRGRVVW